MSETLTNRQRDILRYIAIHDRATRREIGSAFGIASMNGVQEHLLVLERKGMIFRDPLLSRNVHVTDLGFKTLGFRPMTRDAIATILDLLQDNDTATAISVCQEILGEKEVA